MKPPFLEVLENKETSKIEWARNFGAALLHFGLRVPQDFPQAALTEGISVTTIKEQCKIFVPYFNSTEEFKLCLSITRKETRNRIPPPPGEEVKVTSIIKWCNVLRGSNFQNRYLVERRRLKEEQTGGASLSQVYSTLRAFYESEKRAIVAKHEESIRRHIGQRREQDLLNLKRELGAIALYEPPDDVDVDRWTIEIIKRENSESSDLSDPSLFDSRRTRCLENVQKQHLSRYFGDKHNRADLERYIERYLQITKDTQPTVCRSSFRTMCINAGLTLPLEDDGGVREIEDGVNTPSASVRPHVSARPSTASCQSSQAHTPRPSFQDSPKAAEERRLDVDGRESKRVKIE